MYVALLLSRSNDGGLGPWSAVGILAGVFLFFYGFRLLQRRRLILDTPFSKIRSASLGQVEISGLADGPYTLNAPISGRPCYYYRTQVWEYKQRSRSSGWQKIASECVYLPFFVDDNTGRLLVDPRGADLDLHRDYAQEFCNSFFSTKDPAPDAVRDFLARHGVMTTNKIKVEEYCIKPKNALFILGTLAENPGIEVAANPIHDSAGGNSDVFRTLWSPMSFFSFASDVVTVKTTTFSMALTNNSGDVGYQPQRGLSLTLSGGQSRARMTQDEKVADALRRAGISKPAAWAAAGLESAPIKVNSTSVESSGQGFDPHPPVVLMKGTNSDLFLISWRSQREVARSLGWKCMLMIWGGPILTLVSLYYLLSLMRLL